MCRRLLGKAAVWEVSHPACLRSNAPQPPRVAVVEATTPHLQQWNPTAAGRLLALVSKTMVCLEREVGPTLATHSSSLKKMSMQATAIKPTKTVAVESQEVIKAMASPA